MMVWLFNTGTPCVLIPHLAREYCECLQSTIMWLAQGETRISSLFFHLEVNVKQKQRRYFHTTSFSWLENWNKLHKKPPPGERPTIVRWRPASLLLLVSTLHLRTVLSSNTAHSPWGKSSYLLYDNHALWISGCSITSLMLKSTNISHLGCTLSFYYIIGILANCYVTICV